MLVCLVQIISSFIACVCVCVIVLKSNVSGSILHFIQSSACTSTCILCVHIFTYLRICAFNICGCIHTHTHTHTHTQTRERTHTHTRTTYTHTLTHSHSHTHTHTHTLTHTRSHTHTHTHTHTYTRYAVTATCFGDRPPPSGHHTNISDMENFDKICSVKVIIIYLLKFGCYPVAVVILHVNKT